MAVKDYLRLMASLALLLAAFPMIVVFCGLFFYEGPFSWRQIAVQVGLQFLLANMMYLAILCAKRLWPNV